MGRKPLLGVIAIALVVATLLLSSSLPALAAPPLPPTSIATPALAPAAPPVPPTTPWGYPVYHVVQWGENLTQIARRYGTTVWAIAQANGVWNINYIRAGQLLLIPVSTPTAGLLPRIYIVQPGDTLSAIAWRFGTTVWAIAQANGIWNPNLIYIGQALYIV